MRIKIKGRKRQRRGQKRKRKGRGGGEKGRWGNRRNRKERTGKNGEGEQEKRGEEWTRTIRKRNLP